MLLAFVIFLVFTFAFLQWRKTFGRSVCTAAVVLACVFSLFLAYVSVSSVWTPQPLSDDVFGEQNALGEYEGVFPWSRLSYPLYLNVYHTPFQQQTLIESHYCGQACFSIFFATAKVFVVYGTFSYYAYAMGPMPLSYTIDFLFSDSPEFFVSCLLCLLSLTLLEHD